MGHQGSLLSVCLSLLLGALSPGDEAMILFASLERERAQAPSEWRVTLFVLRSFAQKFQIVFSPLIPTT